MSTINYQDLHECIEDCYFYQETEEAIAELLCNITYSMEDNAQMLIKDFIDEVEENIPFEFAESVSCYENGILIEDFKEDEEINEKNRIALSNFKKALQQYEAIDFSDELIN